MQEDDGFTTATISVRIVHIDHYLHPLRDYSSSLPFQAARLTHASAHAAPKLPVIRIFGSTPAGQSCCVHLHGLRPYLYLPLPPTVPPAAAFDYAARLRDALESCLRAAYADAATGEVEPAAHAPPPVPGAAAVPPAGEPDTTRYIAEIDPVLKTDIYGFYASSTVFLKIHTFNPRSVSRIATIVAQRGLPDDLVPHGTAAYVAHIPFYMQFLVDHALTGMAYLNLADFRFRPPLPDPPAKGRSSPLHLFSRRNADRLFVRGLEKIRPGLFWPFHVAKRSTCPLELDSFPQHILNARAAEGEATDEVYSFVSRTLGVLWEEERLRTGKYPPRQKPVERPVKAGGHLSEEYLRERLVEVSKAIDPGPCEPSHSQAADDIVASFVASQAEEPREDILPASYDDVLRVLDATGSFSAEDEDELDIEDFDDNDNEGEDIARGKGMYGSVPLGERANPPADGDHVIDKDWADIAECTQHLSSRDSIDDEADTEAIGGHQSTGAGRADAPEEVVESLSPPFNAENAQHLSRAPPRLSERLEDMAQEDVPTATMFPFYQRPSASEAVEGSQREREEDLKMHLIVRPAERPCSYSFVTQNRSLGDALSITYPSPFYGDKEDEAHPREAFGGMIIPVRRSGAEGYAPFPRCFDSRTTTVEIVPKVVRPTARPPSIASLKGSLVDTAGTTGNGSNKDKFVIDSAGRQVHQRSEGTTRDSLTLSNDLAFDFLPHRPNSGNLSCTFDEDSQPSESSDVPNSEGGLTPNNSEADGSFIHRPLSPKYDEGYQHYIVSGHPTMNTPRRKLLSHSKENANLQKAGDSDSSKCNRNSTVSLSESLHRYQNMTVMSIEVVAECYSDKLPDPGQNPIMAVCAVVQKDFDTVEGQRPSCVIFAVENGQLPKGLHLTTLCYESEIQLLDALATHIRQEDPDVLVGYETQNWSIGYIIDRSFAIGHGFRQAASRWSKGGDFDGNMRGGQTGNSAAAAYYHRKGADIKITGRHVLSLWRIIRKEVKLPAYSREAVVSELFQMTFPRHKPRDLEDWIRSARNSARTVRYLAQVASVNIAIIEKLNILSRTGELARVFGVDFMSVLTRGSQFRVESMLGRVARTRDYLLLSAPREEVFQQPAVEALPLVMEPQSALYVDPVIVLDFQSLYPSVIIAHNLCFSTMLGNLNRISTWSESRRIGVVPKYAPPVTDQGSAVSLENIFVSSSGEMFVDSSVRRGILPQLLKEILETRVMVKKAMKGIVGDDATAGLLNARQFGLKMIANVTYGYTAASFSGRMPCAGLADAIVQCGRDSLEEIVRYVEEELRGETGATVVYGDTDSLFVQVPGATRDEAFTVGERIVAHAAEIFPDPITLKLEKVYQPCILQTKKRYVGYSYESRDQGVPIFDAKGIETVRRDSCPLVQKALERSIRVLFETKNVSLVKRYVQRLCQKLHLDRVPFFDYIFRKEVRLGSYKEGHLPPAAIVATKAMEHDPRAVPRHGERVAFVVLYDRPGAPLKDCVVSPEDYLDAARRGLARLNTTYYITKQILPTLNRVLSLIGVRVGGWYAEIPRPLFDPIVPTRERERKRVRSKQSSLHMFYTAEKCAVCHGKGVEQQVCGDCLADPASVQASRFLLAMRMREQERNQTELVRRCFACVADRAEGVEDVRCCNLICSVYDELTAARRKLAGLRLILGDNVTWSI